jgi:hypothetical protein
MLVTFDSRAVIEKDLSDGAIAGIVVVFVLVGCGVVGLVIYFFVCKNKLI